MNQQPIIILGMHRSGTTMITKMLENLGLFVGAENGKKLMQQLSYDNL